MKNRLLNRGVVDNFCKQVSYVSDEGNMMFQLMRQKSEEHDRRMLCDCQILICFASTVSGRTDPHMGYAHLVLDRSATTLKTTALIAYDMLLVLVLKNLMCL